MNFCTLFDSNYLSKGLALYESLCSHAEDFTLWILCMDGTTFDILEQLDLASVRLILLTQFEDNELLAAKLDRTHAEYCFTCTSSLPLYLLEHEPIESITYLDSDLFFFGDPTPAYDELGEGSIGIVGHRFSSKWAHYAEGSGIYNVGFMIFKNDDKAKECLRWWRERCLEWCYARVEDGKYADQKYLDDWPERFGATVLQHPGLGWAPWNLDQWKGEPIIYYHFHDGDGYGIEGNELYETYAEALA